MIYNNETKTCKNTNMALKVVHFLANFKVLTGYVFLFGPMLCSPLLANVVTSYTACSSLISILCLLNIHSLCKATGKLLLTERIGVSLTEDHQFIS